MRFFPEEGYRRVFVILLYALIGGLLLYAVFRYLFPAFLPFIIAFFAAILLRRPTAYVAGRTHLPRKLIAALFALLFVSALLFGLGFAVWKLIGEIAGFARAVVSGEHALLENLKNALLRIADFLAKLPFFRGEQAENLRGAVTETLLDMTKNAVAELGTKLPEIAGKLASAIPQSLVFCVVTVLSAVYFCADYDKIIAFFRRHLRGKAWETVEKIRSVAEKTLIKVLRSYAVLFLLTFAELFLGFVLLKEPYAFLLALVTALVDSLPIFGTGIILLPMALYRFLIGDIRAAIGIGILYAAVTVIRQIAEPKILGDGIGMHPLLMLISMYTGFRLFGLLGMIFLPPLSMLTKNLISTFSQNEKEKPHASP